MGSINGSEPTPLAQKCLDQFDRLQANESLFYQDTVPEIVKGKFPLQFRLIKAFERKPWPGHEHVKPASKPDPFGHPEPEFVVSEKIPGYVLQLNKFCALRPQLLLHPKSFAPQTERLTQGDFEALCEVMQDLGAGFMAFYNCGKEAGSSQPYKHVQIVPKPEHKEFVMWPDRDGVFDDASNRDVLGPPQELGVPYVTRVGSNQSMTASDNSASYQKLLQSLEEELTHDVGAHNVVMTRDWLCVTPRRASGKDAFPGVNSMGMMGMIWVASQDERDSWNDLGLAQYLSSMGYPTEGS